MTSSPSQRPAHVADRVVSDAGPLISLEKLPDGFPFIRRINERIYERLVASLKEG